MLDQYSKILVTGGAGFIGRHLVSTLLALEKNVVILDNLSTSLDGAAPPGATLARADIRDPGQVADVVKGAELIFHTAANANGTLSVEDPNPDALDQIERGVDLVTFTSPSALRSFHRLVGAEVVANAAVIGPVTADAARELGYRVAVEADPFTIPGLVEAILSHFEEDEHG